MPACHAGGHEFESRTHRRDSSENSGESFVYLMLIISKWNGIGLADSKK